MSKNKKASSSKKIVASSTAKPARRTVTKINSKKVDLINDKINQINKKFENLIEECQIALKSLTESTIAKAEI